jgi:hypothetical protein
MVSNFEYVIYLAGMGIITVWAIAAAIVHFFGKK